VNRSLFVVVQLVLNMARRRRCDFDFNNVFSG